ncbi:MAG: hypothetical protein ACKKL4_03270 [Patescibacteria group bacterium]
MASAIHQIGEKMAQEEKPAPKQFPTLRVGRTVEAAFKCGFVPGNMKCFGFFTAQSDRGVEDIFVHKSDVPSELWDDLATGKVYQVHITDIGSKRPAGKVLFQADDVQDKKRSIARSSTLSLKASKEERAKARQERRERILARGQIDTTDGSKKLHGVPVMGNEWECLPDDTYVVLCEAVDANGTASAPYEAFRVSKQGGKPSKANPRPVSFYQKRLPIQASETGIFTLADGSTIAVPVYDADRCDLTRLESELREHHDGEYFAIRKAGKILVVGEVKSPRLVRIKIDPSKCVHTIEQSAVSA